MKKCLNNILVLAQLDKELPVKVRVELNSMKPNAFVEEEAIKLHKAIKKRSEGTAELLSCAEEAGVDIDEIASIITSPSYKMFMAQSSDQQYKAVKDVSNEYSRQQLIKSFEKAVEKFSSLDAQDNMIKELESVISESVKAAPKFETISLADASAACVDDIIQLKNNGGEAFYPTPFETLNKIIDGLIPGNVTTFCAFTSGGKTAMGCFLTYFYAVKNKRILYLSSESDAKKLNSKFTSVQSQADGVVSFSRRKYMSLEDSDTEDLVKMIARTVEATGNRIDFQMVTSGEEVLMAIAKADEYDIVVLDHFHNLDNSGDVQYCEKLCADIGRTTSKYNRAVLQFAQYNKTISGKQTEPSANHVKGSSALIQNSSVFIHMWAPDDKKGDKEKIYLKVEKNRDQYPPRKYVRLKFIHDKQFFEDRGEVEPSLDEEDEGDDR